MFGIYSVYVEDKLPKTYQSGKNIIKEEYYEPINYNFYGKGGKKEHLLTISHNTRKEALMR